MKIDMKSIQTEPSNVVALRERLFSISPQRAEAVTRLLAAGERLMREDAEGRLELHSNVAQHAPHATTAVLGHAHGQMKLALLGEYGSAALGDRTWHDFSGEARLLAFTLAYETLIARLSALLGMPLLPLELHPAAATSAEIWHWVGFRFERDEQTHCHGLLGLDHAGVDALAAVAGWHRDVETNPRIETDQLPLTCRLMLPALELGAATLRKLDHGDVVVLGRRSALLGALRLRAASGEAAIDSRRAWWVRAATGGISIIRALSEVESRNDMTTPDDQPGLPGSDLSEEGDPRDAIPIRVELLLDTITLTLAELAEISAGQTLALRQSVENSRVTLRANGKVLGSGELVALGDMLGLKVMRIGEARGLQ